MFKRIIIFIFISLFILSSFSLAQTRRVKLMVKGTDGEALQGVKITLTSPERGDFEKVVETNKKGQATFLVHMEIKNVNIMLEKKGYQILQDAKELKRIRKSQEALYYESTFMLYKISESTPEQTRRQYELNQQALSFFDKGMEFFKVEDFSGAVEQFKKAVEIKPDFIQAYQNLAAAYFQSESYEEAIDVAKKILEIDPESAQTIKLLSVAYSKLGDEETALEYQTKLKELPEAEFSPEELFNMGAAAANEGQDEEAAGYFKKATEKKLDYALAYYQLGVVYFRLQKMKEAEEALRKYLELDPDGDYAKNAEVFLEYIVKSKK